MNKLLSSPVAIIILAIMSALFLGVFTVGFAGVFSAKLGLLLALPAVMIVGLIFLYDRYLLFMMILLLRPALDPLLDKTKIGGFGVGGMLNALVILIALIAIFDKKFELRSIAIKLWAPFLFILLLAVGFAPERTPAIKLYLSILSNAAMFTLALSLIKSEVDFGRWMRIVLISSLIPVLYGFIDFARGGTLSADAGMRVQSTFSHPNILAFYLMLMITLSFYFIKSRVLIVSPFVKRLLPLYIIMMIALLLFTKTRSAWIACFAFFAIYGLLYERKYLIFVIAAPLIALLFPEMRERIVDLAQGNEVITYGTLNSYAWRKYIWTSGLSWMRPSHYLLGYGIESFLYYSMDFFPLAGGMQRGAHSVYVQLIFDTGAIGFLTFIWLYCSFAYRLSKFYKENKVMIFSALTLLIQYAMIAYSDNLLSYLAFNWYFWYVLGAIYAFSYHNRKRNEAELNNTTLN